MTINIEKLIDIISAHEGTFTAVNRNDDGAGVSIGLWQWNQRDGGLSLVLNAYHTANATLFRNIFGEHWQALLRTAEQRSMSPVGGVVLWQEPWVSRFQRAGQNPTYQQVQRQLAQQSEYVAAASKAVQILGVTSERAFALTLDTAVNQGPNTAIRYARRVVGQYEGRTVPSSELLAAYAAETARPYRAVSPPGPTKNPRLSWKLVGADEWHLFAHRTNLYRSIAKRRRQILTHQDLLDVAVSV